MRAAIALWRREMIRFGRQPSRVVGVVLQPLLVWAIAAIGFSGIFRFPGVDQLQAAQFFFPGIIVMMLLFNGIFSTISVIEDRQAGFLQAALAGPSARAGIVIGKILSSLTVGLGQCGLFLCLAPLAGFNLSATHWPLLILAVVFTATGCTLIGMIMAWRLRTSSAYHALMSALLLPGWFLSGAVFPLPAESPLGTVLRMNPFAWMVDLTRSAVYGSELPEGLEDIMLSVPQALGYLSVLVVICGLVSLRQVGGRHG
tara:strand:- start:369 stop:1139 length:771 start_codon:yes stop_codon:yes gene_type:complete